MTSRQTRSINAMTEKITTALHAATMSAQTFQNHLHHLTVLTLLQRMATHPISKLAVTTFPVRHGDIGILGQLQWITPQDKDLDTEYRIQQYMAKHPVPLAVYREFDEQAAIRTSGQARITLNPNPSHYENLIQDTLQTAWHHMTVFHATDATFGPSL